MTNYTIVSNNKKIRDQYKDSERFTVDFLEYDVELGYITVLEEVRKLLHQGGYKLATHPLSGSVKPNETPFKSVIVENTKDGAFDMEGTMILEDAITTFNKFRSNRPLPPYEDHILDDFREIDYSLITGAMDRLKY